MIAKAGQTTEILTSRDDAAVVHHAASSFAADLMQMVPSSNVVVRNVTANSFKMSTQQGKKERVVIVGSVAESSLMRGLASMDSNVGKEADKVKGQWEAWSSSMLRSSDNSTQGLVLMGSDKRGAAYAMYTLSEELGVSPWKWFADVHPTQSHDAVYYSPRLLHRTKVALVQTAALTPTTRQISWHLPQRRSSCSHQLGSYPLQRSFSTRERTSILQRCHVRARL